MADDATPIIGPPPLEIGGDAVRIAVAYLSNPSTRIEPDQIGDVILDIYRAVERRDEAPTSAPAAPHPAVPIEESVGPDYLICLEDGEKLKMLKRYLRAQYGMSPEEYRAKWGLPVDYPMVAPDYSSRRSQLAKQQGLGRRPAPVKKPRRKRA